MPDYRWNALENARGYDQAAEHVHPYYRQIQDVILDRLPCEQDFGGWIADLGGGSGRLAERILRQYPNAKVCVVDQSEPFLTLAAERLTRFGNRAVCVQSRLQEDWSAHLPEQPAAIVSMSAIHHLDPLEKNTLYKQAAECLSTSGVLMNGDEVRPAGNEDYLSECQRWAEHMQRVMREGLIPECLHEALNAWITRNVQHNDQPRVSGDDVHETIETQLEYFAAAGLIETQAIWQRELWALLYGQKAAKAIGI